MTTTVAEFYCTLFSEQKRFKFLRGFIRGTVFSGHPLRTTFGNSMRVYYYVKYICSLARMSNYKIFVCGDDTLLLMQKVD
jgi:hypothetical protein